MIFEKTGVLYPKSTVIRDDGQIVTGKYEDGMYFEAEGRHFPIAYLVRDVGPYLNDSNPRAEFAHYHPLAH